MGINGGACSGSCSGSSWDHIIPYQEGEAKIGTIADHPLDNGMWTRTADGNYEKLLDIYSNSYIKSNAKEELVRYPITAAKTIKAVYDAGTDILGTGIDWAFDAADQAVTNYFSGNC